MAYKRLPIAYSVPSVQSNMPLVARPSLTVGWGALTLPEAQSSRWYADEGMVVEIAREAVSADEIHYKMPTVPVTGGEVFTDYDGVRADYAVGGAFGRNAVWTGYTLVLHQQSAVDATGNYTITQTGTVNFNLTATKVGNSGSQTLGNSISFLQSNINFNTGNTAKSISCWFNWQAPTSNRGWLIAGGADINDQAYGFFVQNNNGLYFHGNGGLADFTISNSVTVGWNYVTASYNGAGVNTFTYNGSLAGTRARTLNTGANNIRFHLRLNNETTSRFNGYLDEIRVKRANETSNDWFFTEYANQNDPASFYGTVTDAGSTTEIVNAVLPSDYAVNAVAGSDLPAGYTVLSDVISTTPVTYAVLRRETNVTPATYRVQSGALVDVPANYTILSSTLVEAPADYRVRNVDGDVLLAGYAIYVEVTRETNLLPATYRVWNIRRGETEVYEPRANKYPSVENPYTPNGRVY